VTALSRLGNALAARQRGLLIGVLAVLHLALWAQGDLRFGTLCWLVDVGLFMLWQPFIHSERRLGAMSLTSFAVMLGIGIWGYGTALLLLWAGFLAALVGGRVLFVEHRGTRLFYLLAFAYLLGAILLFVLPRLVPNAGDEGAMLVRVFLWLGPVLLLVMAVVPVRGALDKATVGPVDFIYSLFVFLLVAVVALGSLAFMVLRQTGYVEALFGTVLVMAAMLFLLGWAKSVYDIGLGAWIAGHVVYERRSRVVGLTETSWALGLLDGVGSAEAGWSSWAGCCCWPPGLKRCSSPSAVGCRTSTASVPPRWRW
jgi:hypothetical protein